MWFMKRSNQSCPFGKKRGAGSWHTIYHHCPVIKGVCKQTPLFSSTNQWEFGTSMEATNNYGDMIYDHQDIKKNMGT
jgi:hypothetical protein